MGHLKSNGNIYNFSTSDFRVSVVDKFLAPDVSN